MNQEQCQLFNLLAKPLVKLKQRNISNENDMSSNLRMTLCLENLKANVDLEKLENYYMKMKSEGKKASEIDQRLINMMDEKL